MLPGKSYSMSQTRPECNILNTEITEKEMAKIPAPIITIPKKSDSRFH